MGNINKQLKITPLSTLKDYANGEIVEFPPFAANMPFVARLKRPSMMVLMKAGKIPNSLLETANALFSDNASTKSQIDEKFYKEVLEIIETIAEASFIEPTWQEIKDNGIELTDEQYTFLFNYSQKGIQALEPFREQSEDSRDTANGKDV